MKKNIVYWRGFGLGVETGELFDIQFAVSVFVESFEQNDDLWRRKVERRVFQDERSLFQCYEAVTVSIVFLEFRKQLNFATASSISSSDSVKRSGNVRALVRLKQAGPTMDCRASNAGLIVNSRIYSQALGLTFRRHRALLASIITP